jgi:WD40 repeat protein
MQVATGVPSSGIWAHEAEVLSLCYSPLLPSNMSSGNESGVVNSDSRVLLASGGRDRLVHVFDASLGVSPSSDCRYDVVNTLDNHSSSVTVVKFTPDGRRLVSCGGDKQMVINTVKDNSVSCIKVIPTAHGAINGLAVDVAMNKYAVSSGQDKRINVWNLYTGKMMRSYRPQGVDSELYKTCMDPSGMDVL